MTAGLLAMAARASKEGWSDAAGAVAQAESLRRRATPLAEEDARAYQAALEAMRSPSGATADERDAAIADALSRAAQVPLEIAETAADVAALAATISERGDQQVRGDAAAAAALLWRLVFPRRAAWAGHRHALVLDEVARVGGAVLLALQGPTRVAVPLELVHRELLISEEPTKHVWAPTQDDQKQHARTALTPKYAKHNLTRYEGRDAQGPSGSFAVGLCTGWLTPRLCLDQGTAPAELWKL